MSNYFYGKAYRWIPELHKILNVATLQLSKEEIKEIKLKYNIENWFDALNILVYDLLVTSDEAQKIDECFGLKEFFIVCEHPSQGRFIITDMHSFDYRVPPFETLEMNLTDLQCALWLYQSEIINAR